MGAYLFGSARVTSEDEGFADALAAAHADRLRPKCLCLVHGIEMYVARLAGTDAGFIVKRMPGTGSRHAPDCASYEPPPEASGLGQVLGTAIKEDPATGETALKLGFSMSKLGNRATMPAPGTPSDSVASDGSKLSLRGLLHYLWDQAELTRWQPGFVGKRSWGTVRKHLLLAAENKVARGEALRSRLYIPEPFSIEQRDALNARRIAQWSHAVAAPGKPQHLMLLIGEVKEIVPARYGYKAVIKHVPDQAFALDDPLYRRLGRRLGSELALWASADTVHMVVIATFGVSEAGIPTIGEMSLMPVTPQWLPVEDSFERQLVERLVVDGRVFIKGLRYNLHRGQCLATATLTDTGGAGSLMFVVPPGLEETAVADGVTGVNPRGDAPVWVWRRSSEAMPQLPAPVKPISRSRG
ncbi:DUF1173 domain-containing protein [Aquabacterium sp. J223]|uniref:DUF1173 domain-containing protein n=1 Tax=Aquabacterium sp. J223 TaxID=2898431 RepID=UPI0021ADB1FE|nr:DUF1173 domain-containing protein [Aquabacterium sp. J223]UUX97291.1 DUF1173 domain-containing protein [Aquabacterium sp. J223]